MLVYFKGLNEPLCVLFLSLLTDFDETLYFICAYITVCKVHSL